ncbi:hypothetical protein N9N67_08285, partial [Bacteriovoracaceae bacterium]|nr:hypothetical protein [Bacteriovoracaceae bacterium]
PIYFYRKLAMMKKILFCSIFTLNLAYSGVCISVINEVPEKMSQLKEKYQSVQNLINIENSVDSLKKLTLDKFKISNLRCTIIMEHNATGKKENFILSAETSP